MGRWIRLGRMKRKVSLSQTKTSESLAAGALQGVCHREQPAR
jgi:hypothetical protein